MTLPRASGILLHPTSLPGRFGIGDLGPEAVRFVEFLAEAGQTWWQMLPIGPTAFGNSPYQSPSSFAGNPLLISPEWLVEDRFLDAADLADYPDLSAGRVDYDAVRAAKTTLLRRAFGRFDRKAAPFVAFRKAAKSWLDDYAQFMTLKEAHGGVAWYDWDPKAALRRPAALTRAKKELAERIDYYAFEQFVFDRQWERLRAACRSRGIRIIGDLPIFVAPDSADVWARPELFELDERGRPTVVAGVPPDYFSADGQRWGNPLYRWPAHAAEEYGWWTNRLRAQLVRADLVRLDHFRGLEAYWEVPASAPTAATGRWAPGPDAALLEALRQGLGSLPLIAEDLGEITPRVEALRDHFDLPGMRVLQFAFGDDAKANDYLPWSFIRHCVAYTGTHDNDTTLGWFRGSEGQTTQSAEVKAAEQAFVLRYTGTDGSQVHWDLIRLTLGSVADTAIIPLQDVLGLGSEARMNLPGRPLGNWEWRYRAEQLDQAARDRLADLTAVYHRWNGPVPARWHQSKPLQKVEPSAVSPADGTPPSPAKRPKRAGKVR